MFDLQFFDCGLEQSIAAAVTCVACSGVVSTNDIKTVQACNHELCSNGTMLDLLCMQYSWLSCVKDCCNMMGSSFVYNKFNALPVW